MAGAFDEGPVSNFHSIDPNLIINAFRLVLEGIKSYRSSRGEQTPDKQEEVLQDTVERARELSAEGAGTDKVVSEIESRLEQGLGVKVKEEMIGRASSILALAQPFEIESFRYCENLVLVLNRAQEFCSMTNIFRLRGTADGNATYLALPKVGLVLPRLFRNFREVAHQLEGGDVFQASPTSTRTYLMNRMQFLYVLIAVEVRKAYAIGGSYSENVPVELRLKAGSEINSIGFAASTPLPYTYLKDIEVRLTAKDFQEVISAILDDINNYATELATEQKEFRERIAPALGTIMSVWTKPQ